jgi:hypothetical protein
MSQVVTLLGIEVKVVHSNLSAKDQCTGCVFGKPGARRCPSIPDELRAGVTPCTSRNDNHQLHYYEAV